MVLGFAGLAYVGDETTDNWIARLLVGKQLPRMPDGRIPAFSQCRIQARTFNDTCWLLQKAIEAEPSFGRGNGIEVAISGWRRRRGRLSQTLLAITRTESGVTRHGHMRLITNLYGSSALSIGVIPTPEIFRSVSEAYCGNESLLVDSSTRAAFLADVIALTSDTNQAVGSDVMTVEIPCGIPKVTVRYTPGLQRYAALVSTMARPIAFQAAYWPWMITPFWIKSPTVSTGGSGMTWRFGDWELCQETTVPQHIVGLVHAESSLRRTRPPTR